MNKIVALRIAILIFYFKREINEKHGYEIGTLNDVLMGKSNTRYVSNILKTIKQLK